VKEECDTLKRKLSEKLDLLATEFSQVVEKKLLQIKNI
jgi:hypothetical protein